MATSALRTALGMQDPMMSMPSVPGMPAGTPLQKAERKAEDVGRKIESNLLQQAEFGGASKQFEAEQRQREAAGQAEILAAEASTLREAEAPIRLAEEERMNARFTPTRETATEMAALYSLVGILGFGLGAGGKQSAMNAMSAMNGMLEGYREGSADRYRKEKQDFDTNLKTLSDNITTLNNRLQRVQKLATVDKLQAQQELSVTLAEYGADFVKENINKFGLEATLKYLQQLEKAAQTAVTKERDIEARAEQRVRDEQARLERQREAARDRAALVASRVTVGKKKLMQGSDGKMYAYDPDKETFTQVAMPAGVQSMTPPGGKAGQNALTFASRVYGNIENSAADLKNIVALPATSELPVLSGLLNVERATALGSLESLVARKITNAENRAFQQVSDQLGAALSRMEAQGLASGATKANIASFNSLRPGAGDNAINMAIYLARVKQEIETGIKVHNKMPGATQEQKEATKLILDDLNNVVPFSVDDTLNVLKKSKKPLGEKMQKLVSQPQVANNLSIGDSAAQTVEPKTAAPTGAKQKANPGEQIFEDAKGNKAVKRNGQWVEVE